MTKGRRRIWNAGCSGKPMRLLIIHDLSNPDEKLYGCWRSHSVQVCEALSYRNPPYKMFGVCNRIKPKRYSRVDDAL